MPNAGAGRWLPLVIVFAMIAAGTAPPCGAAHLAPDSGRRTAPGRPSGGDPRKDREIKVEVFLGSRKIGALEQAERLKSLGSSSDQARPYDSVTDYGNRRAQLTTSSAGDGNTGLTTRFDGCVRNSSESPTRSRGVSEAPFRSRAAGTVRDYQQN